MSGINRRRFTSTTLATLGASVVGQSSWAEERPKATLPTVRWGKYEISRVLVGHNPTFEELADLLTGAAEEGALATMSRKFPTGALAILDFPVRTWANVQAGGGYLRGFVRPKDLT